MDGFPVDTVLALIGIAIPVGAFLWEFVLVGRNRIGYRVQMDTPVTSGVDTLNRGLLDQLPGANVELRDLSIVLVRIENSGTSAISENDYLQPSQQVGLHLRFPKRRVMGMTVTELSDDDLQSSLGGNSGIATTFDAAESTGEISLPKVPLNKGDHYKILAILQRVDGTGVAPDPVVKGNIRRGTVRPTQSRTGVSRLVFALMAFLVTVIVVQFAVAMFEPPPDPLDCARGSLTLVGSSAFETVIRDAATQYGNRCSGADFTFAFEGTERGLDRLTEAGPAAAMITVSDGPKGPGYPALSPRPLALSSFAVIVHPDLGVGDLSAEQIEALFRGTITNWREVGGPDLAVVLVDRAPGSGTRALFEQRMLGVAPPQRPHRSCTAIVDTAGTFCDVESTEAVHRAVAALRGAVGYSELAEAREAGARVVTIGGVTPGRDGGIDRSYPFWGVEFAYTHGDPPSGSLAASFLHYLTDDVGAEVLRAHGNEPCGSVALAPGRCAPSS